jgi:hypothetical protein
MFLLSRVPYLRLGVIPFVGNISAPIAFVQARKSFVPQRKAILLDLVAHLALVAEGGRWSQQSWSP